jgi:hypothetical protein
MTGPFARCCLNSEYELTAYPGPGDILSLECVLAPQRPTNRKTGHQVARELDETQEPAGDLVDRVGEAVEVGGLDDIGVGVQ